MRSRSEGAGVRSSLILFGVFCLSCASEPAGEYTAFGSSRCFLRELPWVQQWGMVTPPAYQFSDWTRCEAWYEPGGGAIKGAVPAFGVMLYPDVPSATGFPPGYLELTVGDTSSGSSAEVVTSPSGPLGTIGTREAKVEHILPTSKFVYFDEGWVRVARASFTANGTGAAGNSFDLELVFDSATNPTGKNGSDDYALNGSLRLSSTSPPSSGGGGGTGGGGGGGGDTCSTKCEGMCTGATPEQSCLYCQAACLCRCAGDTSCAEQNARQAAALGRSGC